MSVFNESVSNNLQVLNVVKREARTLADVEKWFVDNLQLFEFGDDVEVHSVSVKLNFSVILDTFFEDNPENTLTMLVRTSTALPQKPTPSLFAALDAKATREKTVDDRWVFRINMSEWSFIVANIALSYLAMDFADDTQRPDIIKAKEFLRKELPKHFPDMDIDNLIALRDGGLLDLESQEPGLDLLFSSRTQTSSAALPESVSVDHGNMPQ